MIRESRPPRNVQVLLLILALLSALPVGARQQSARPASTLRFYLARHGETDWNREGRTQGAQDIPLNNTGRQQAQRLKERLAGVRFDAVYASSLRRSRETAEIVHGEVPITILPDLAERRFGKFEGRVTTNTNDGDELQRRMWLPDDSLDGGESLNALKERARDVVNRIRMEHPSGSVLIVGHSYTNRMILSAIFNLSTDQIRSFEQANDELYQIELEPGIVPHLWKLITESNLKDL
jgi:broad specificity phosphatase PhoE